MIVQYVLQKELAQASITAIVMSIIMETNVRPSSAMELKEIHR